jgi:putative endonuclease
MWYVYLARCSDNSLYCGITNNLDRRVKAHNSGKGAKYTRSRLPIKFVWHEKHPDKSSALSAEYKIKQLSKSKKELLVNQDYC